MVLRTLRAMALGGMRDHVGGGFHRYSTDAGWRVPHFEKMLYDQAQLAWAYLEAFQATRESEYAATAHGLFDYVARDLTSPEGGFFSAEDADSEGEEGRFYVWTPDQIRAVLDETDARLVAAVYDVTGAGNFEHGTSILHEVRPLDAVASERGLEDAPARLARARAALFAAREHPVRPHRDEQV